MSVYMLKCSVSNIMNIIYSTTVLYLNYVKAITLRPKRNGVKVNCLAPYSSLRNIAMVCIILTFSNIPHYVYYVRLG